MIEDTLFLTEVCVHGGVDIVLQHMKLNLSLFGFHGKSTVPPDPCYLQEILRRTEAQLVHQLITNLQFFKLRISVALHSLIDRPRSLKDISGNGLSGGLLRSKGCPQLIGMMTLSLEHPPTCHDWRPQRQL